MADAITFEGEDYTYNVLTKSINKQTTVFMGSGADSDFSVINEFYYHFFPNNPPERSAPQVMLFPGSI